jgi:porin
MGALVPSADAQEVPPDLRSRPALLDGPGSPKEALRAHGIQLDGSLTQFYQGVVSGDGNKHWQYGVKGDLIVTFDGAKLGLWRGFYVNVHQEWVGGEDANNQGDGSLFPLNTALGFPRLGGYERDTSIVVTLVVNEALTVSAGKFNMLDAAAKTPLLGGGGLDTFMNVGLAAPISGVTPPYIIGAIATLKTRPAIFTLMVYDPRNAQDWEVIEKPFDKGTTTSLSITVPTTIGGLTGYYGVRAVYSSKTGLDLASVPNLVRLPAQSANILTKDGYWFLSASMQQNLFQSPGNPSQGWGIFAQANLSDGNPNPIEWGALVGLGGTSFVPGRESDRWGVGYFHYGLSSELLDGLKALNIELRDERGLEAFYNLAITPWFRVTADVQWINPFRPDRDDAVIAALRTQTKF